MWTDRRSGLVSGRGNNDHRDPYERDRTRVIHSSPFRRLQRKNQILGTKDCDFHRTRLTHSLEVASIGRALVRNITVNQLDNSILSILPSDDLISVICLLHDIGHPPFGHGGEVALNYMMREHGGFEANAQTLRLITKIEESYGEFGLDLTRRTLLGILKYPVPRSSVVAKVLPKASHSINKNIRINDWLPPKAYFDEDNSEVMWLFKPFSEDDKKLLQQVANVTKQEKHAKSKYHSFDCSIMNIADDIAYGVHDLEDAIQLKLVDRNKCDTELFRELLKETEFASSYQTLIDSLFSEAMYERKEAIGKLVNYFITSVEVKVSNDDFADDLLKYKACLLPEALALLEYLKRCIFEYVIDSQSARICEYSGQIIVQRLFEALSSNPEDLLDIKNRLLYSKAQNEQQAMRVISDYIANMTDGRAHSIHEQLFGFSATNMNMVL